MAEKFKTYGKSVATTEHSELVIIGESGGSDRSSGEVAQIHSIYISQRIPSDLSRIKGVERYNPANFSAFDLYIKKGNNKYYIVYDGRVVPGAPFFIEKNITLETDQSLILYCPNNSYEYDINNPKVNKLLNDNIDDNIGAYIDVVASAVLFPTV